MKKIILTRWSNSFEQTKRDLKELGNKILRVTESGNGHLITYQHPTLTVRPEQGDLVEYIDYDDKRCKSIVMGLYSDDVLVKNYIMDIGRVTKIIKKQMIPKKLFKYIG